MFYSFFKALLKPYFYLVYRIKAFYEHPFPKEGPVVVCGKHISGFDGPFVILALKRHVRFMAKSELYRNPIVGWFIRNMGAFPIDRGRADITALKKAISILKNGEVLGIFPEGTRTHENDNALEFKTGAINLAFKTRAVIVPFGMYAEDYRIRPWHRTEIRFGRPITTQELGMTSGNKQDLTMATEKLSEIIKNLSEKNYEKRQTC
ncbi:lysophospholipid acyltransferase family protein [Feifania hominis]|uniref:1-acyl-sn-glycerol-3-phosphate acyltransferase n=1 Tax=Feifania hominis TaxID=2763660 RepID=A0A926DCW9_9FIRM|nr:lysophospholipid acyltransferase family protein [Feifania hominis]MBC8535527.1 1-acyl-sn-glycerol-3-phosphate acyltransferase [Feifania hominis]